MQKYLTALMVVMLIWLSCGSDSAAPEVQITNPIAGSIVTGLVDITISASDNEGLDRVVLYINNSIVETFTSEPYSYLWATESLPDSSLHDLLAKAYDINENEGVSETVTVTVSNDSICGSVYIWNYDPFDKFYDPEIGDTVDCAYRLEQALLSAGYGCEKGITLPVNLNNYDLIFVTLGWFRC